ncbi:MAG: flagellar protein FlgN [Peptococcaceae bacterium]|nr:flagellar protein FlgN [Peptococcaceae bacterium]
MSGNCLNKILTRMIDLLARKKGLMERIFNITVEQSKLLTPEKVEDLLATIERKQEYINEISLIDAEVAPLEKEVLRLNGMPVWDGSNKGAKVMLEEVENLRKQMVVILEDTRKLENENLSKISLEHQKLKDEIALLHTKRGTLKAYQGYALQSDGYFIDKKK